MLSPGVLAGFSMATRMFDNPFAYTVGFHIGEELQNISLTKGYNQDVEDRLLAGSGWEKDGYQLFEVSCLAASALRGYFGYLTESNCFLIKKSTFLKLNGMLSSFTTPGGGLVNLDFFQRASRFSGIVPVLLLGEGSFHQFHGGVATNVAMEQHPNHVYQDEYKSIYRAPFSADPDQQPFYLGKLNNHARKFAFV